MIDVIIRCNTSQACDIVVEKIALEGGVLKDRLDAVNMIFATIPDSKFQEFKSIPGVLEINIDEEVFALETVGEYQRLMKIDEFKDNVSKGRGVKIGIVDTGVFVDHPSLKPNFVEGYNTVKRNADVSDSYGHGTKVAGIICSIGPTNVGVAPESKFYIAKVMSDSNYISSSSVIGGIQWCIDKGVDIINISLGSTTPCSTFKAVTDLAIKNNIIIVAASGYESSPKSPACTPGVICVGCAREVNGDYVTYVSCESDRIDLVAQGFLLVTTSNNGGAVGFFGTSATSSVITGILALLKSAYPTLGREDLINRLYSMCRDLGTPGKDPVFGRGIPIMTTTTVPTPTPVPTPMPTPEPTPVPDITPTPAPGLKGQLQCKTVRSTGASLNGAQIYLSGLGYSNQYMGSTEKTLTVGIGTYSELRYTYPGYQDCVISNIVVRENRLSNATCQMKEGTTPAPTPTPTPTQFPINIGSVPSNASITVK